MHKITMDRQRKNMVGKKLKKYRKEHGMSFRSMASLFQKNGLEWDKNAVFLAEQEARAVIDIELYYLSKILCLSYNELLENDFKKKSRSSFLCKYPFQLWHVRHFIFHAQFNPCP